MQKEIADFFNMRQYRNLLKVNLLNKESHELSPYIDSTIDFMSIFNIETIVDISKKLFDMYQKSLSLKIEMEGTNNYLFLERIITKRRNTELIACLYFLFDHANDDEGNDNSQIFNFIKIKNEIIEFLINNFE